MIPTQTVALEQWAASLVSKQVVAVNVDRDEQNKGRWPQKYWLALLLGPAFPLSERMVHSASAFEEGWLVVEAKWFDLVQVSHRAYVLLDNKVLLLVNTLVRLGDIQFEKVVKSGSGKKMVAKHMLADNQHNRIENCTNI